VTTGEASATGAGGGGASGIAGAGTGGGGAGGATTGAGGAAGTDPTAGAGGGAAGMTGAAGGADAGDAAAGGPTDGGSSDAAPASDAAPTGGACATALYCDDFESYAAPGNPGGMWKTSTQAGGTLSVDATHAYSGKNAVHVMNPGGAAFERAFMSLEGAPIFPLPHDTLFGRMMIYVTKVPSSTVHWTIIQGEGSMVPGFPNLTQAVYRYGGQISGNKLMSNYDTQPGRLSDCAQRSQVAVPENKWACVEWRFDGELKELDFWLNGTIIPALSVRQIAVPAQGACQNPTWSGVWEPPTFDAIRLGWQHYQQGPGEAWIDDVAIDTKRIGCPAAP
jgi:hypothetical protein